MLCKNIHFNEGFVIYLQKKVEKYWPDINDELIFGNIKIKYMSKEIFANFEYTQFSVYCEDHERKVIIVPSSLKKSLPKLWLSI